jgi:sugar lactone lactonase YvrE
MSSSPFDCVLDARASLGESPVWSVSEQVLYWVDINAPALHRFDPASGRDVALPMPESIGCIALRRRGGFVAALRGGVWFAGAGGALVRKVADAPYDPSHHRFNDGRCDRQGRFFAGSMNERRDAATAALYRLDVDVPGLPEPFCEY